MNVAIIPARGGSKRIPKKNIKKFCGQPMIAYSIQAAKASGCFERIIVSTDDQAIASVAIEYGAEVPFFRPKELSDDFTGTIPVIRHAIEMLEQQNAKPISAACCIYATAPFIQPLDIITGLKQLQNNVDCLYSFSVTSYPYPIQRAIKVTHDKRTEMFQPEFFNVRSQDLEDAYHDAGQFYWGRKEAWLNEKNIFSSHSMPIILPRYRVQDIDTQEDWLSAELMFEMIMRKRKTQ